MRTIIMCITIPMLLIGCASRQINYTVDTGTGIKVATYEIMQSAVEKPFLGDTIKFDGVFAKDITRPNANLILLEFKLSGFTDAPWMPKDEMKFIVNNKTYTVTLTKTQAGIEGFHEGAKFAFKTGTSEKILSSQKVARVGMYDIYKVRKVVTTRYDMVSTPDVIERNIIGSATITRDLEKALMNANDVSIQVFAMKNNTFKIDPKDIEHLKTLLQIKPAQ